ncbi:sensor histidine kinase [Aurantiacibacter spongiae]|uniref:histidine kinase n=1 Tax=Aurantiacibacter spongiae TaxID=2488860 RepID=A0A3N5CN40_9SPHN|nr:HAMP domain-containing sensor histidine kinase [Aurantiacibacter spongiae]RPF70364.1 sensor histidine kinase [Aurantiacibacter spongiae]
MVADRAFTARARTDAHDRLVEADEPLAGFHRRSGGELPGPIVTPSLLELVRKSREFGLRLARPVRAQDDRDLVNAWIEVEPDGEGVAIGIVNWQAEALPADTRVQRESRELALARHLAGLTARLGPAQEVLIADAHASDLVECARRMADRRGRAWTECLREEASRLSAPVHWRLLSGATFDVSGSPRRWIARIAPLGSADGSKGFELLLLPETPLPEVPPARHDEPDRTAGIGRDIAPVLRQPVSRIIANAETIRTQLAGPLAEEYSNYAADIASAGEHLLALIDDLTTLEMVEDEDFDPAPDEIDLADVARRAAGILGVRASERGLTLRAPDETIRAPAIGEFRRVLQVLLNLVGNAIRYSPEGGRVDLRVSMTGDMASITVADEGEGLTEDEQARVFAKFERLGRSGDGGSGLGLYISRRLAEAMNGSLTVESAKGQGARFTLSIPADRAEDG